MVPRPDSSWWAPRSGSRRRYWLTAVISIDSETGHLAAACPANYVAHISPRPLWLINGTFDGDYDKTLSVEPLVRHAGESVEMNWVDTGHVVLRAEDTERLVAWLVEVMR